MRALLRPNILALSLAITAACGDYSTVPNPPPPPSAQAGLWTVSGEQSQLLRLEPGQLLDTGDRDPATTVTTSSASLSTLAGLAFDDAGNLWVTSVGASLVVSFEAGALASSGHRVARRVLTPVAGSLSEPSGIAFDRQDRLWVVNRQSSTLVRFDPEQLRAGGPQVPAVVIGLPARAPVALAFDAAGSLWVSDVVHHTLSKFTAGQLAVSGSPVPARLLTAESSLVNPAGLAFDASGNLWVANIGAENLVGFTPGQLAGAGAPAPRFVVTAAAGSSLDIPVGLAFDKDGALWVVGASGFLTQFARASLGSSGAKTPTAQIRLPNHSILWSAAFWPTPAGLPLNGHN